jgi:hypothetical protein
MATQPGTESLEQRIIDLLYTFREICFPISDDIEDDSDKAACKQDRDAARTLSLDQDQKLNILSCTFSAQSLSWPSHQLTICQMW